MAMWSVKSIITIPILITPKFVKMEMEPITSMDSTNFNAEKLYLQKVVIMATVK